MGPVSGILGWPPWDERRATGFTTRSHWPPKAWSSCWTAAAASP